MSLTLKSRFRETSAYLSFSTLFYNPTNYDHLKYFFLQIILMHKFLSKVYMLVFKAPFFFIPPPPPIGMNAINQFLSSQKNFTFLQKNLSVNIFSGRKLPKTNIRYLEKLMYKQQAISESTAKRRGGGVRRIAQCTTFKPLNEIDIFMHLRGGGLQIKISKFRCRLENLASRLLGPSKLE